MYTGAIQVIQRFVYATMTVTDALFVFKIVILVCKIALEVYIRAKFVLSSNIVN